MESPNRKPKLQRRRWLWLIALLLALPLTSGRVLGQAPEVQTWTRFEIGNLVLSDLQPGKAVLGAREHIDGIEYRHFRLGARSGRFEYKAPPGTPTALRGRLTNVDIRGLFSHAQLPGVPPIFQVPRGRFKITLDPEIGELEGFYGGTVRLPDTRVWVENPEEIRLTPATNEGSLAFRSHPVRLHQIRIDLPLLEEPFRTDLVSLAADRHGGGARFLFSFADSSLRLVGGIFESGARPAAAGIVSADSHDIEFAGSGAERLRVRVRETGLDVEFKQFRAQIDALLHFPGAPAPAVAHGSISVGSVHGAAPSAADRALLADLELDHLQFAPESAGSEPAAARSALGGAACTATANALTAAEIGFLERRGLPSPQLQRMRSIQAAASGLAQLPRVDLALYLPRERVLALIRGASGVLGPLVDTMHFGRQELVQCLRPAMLSPELGALLPFELLVHYGLAIEGGNLVIRPAVRLMHVPRLQLDESVLLSALLQRLRTSTERSAEALPAEVRIPLPFEFKQAVDVAQASNLGVTVTADGVTVDVTVEQAALLVDEHGLHLLAALR